MITDYIYQCLDKMHMQALKYLVDNNVISFSETVYKWEQINKLLPDQERLGNVLSALQDAARESIERHNLFTLTLEKNECLELKEQILKHVIDNGKLDKINGQLVYDKGELESKLIELEQVKRINHTMMSDLQAENNNLRNTIKVLIQLTKEMEQRIEDNHNIINESSGNENEYKSDFMWRINHVEHQMDY